MPVTVLKRKHSLKGKNIFPLLKKVKESDNVAGSLARLATQTKTDDLDEDELRRSFKEITGEKADEFLQMAGKTVDLRNLKMLLHHTIIEANKSGQSGQTPMTPESAVSIISIYSLL